MNLPITQTCTGVRTALHTKLTAGIKIFLMLFLFVGSIAPRKLSAQVTAIPGWANVLTPAGGFSIDGDLFANTSTNHQGDWMWDGTGSGTGRGVLKYLTPVIGSPIDPTKTYHLIDFAGNGLDPSGFPNSNKINDNPTSYAWGPANVNNKTDINNVLAHITSDAAGNLWMVVAGDRLATNGSSYLDFEFLQKTLAKTGTTSGGFTSLGTANGRTINDLLVTLEFNQGGAQANIVFRKWTQTSPGIYEYVVFNAPTNAAYVSANIGAANIPSGYTAFGNAFYTQNQFGEAAINLTALVADFDPCIGIATLFVRTRTSGASSSSELSDFPGDLIQLNLQLGSQATGGTNQSLCAGTLGSTTFNLSGSTSVDPSAIASTTWSVFSGSATFGAGNTTTSSDLATTAHVTSATATVRLTVVRTNGCTANSDVVLTRVANPVALVLTGSSICASNPGTGTISSSTSQTGVTYTLYNSGGTSQGSKAGTGSGLTWNTLAAGTGYYVTSVGATPTSCPGGSNTADVTSVANPVDLVLTGSSICASNPGTGTISSSTSQTGVTYTLYNSGGTSQGSKAGTGSGLTWNTLAAGTGYYVTSVGATPTSCPGGSNTADVTSVANPVDLVLTGSSICASNPGTGTISSSTSQTGVTYTLYNSGGTSQGSKAGTGSGLTWNTLAAGTGYYVTSVGATPTSCPGGSNTADVTSVANPVDLVLTGSSICASNPGTGTISSSTSQTGVTYTLYNSGGTSQGSKAGTGSGLTWNTLAAGTGYYVTSVGATPTSCPGGSNTADVTSVANPVDLVLTGSSICASNPGTGTISSSTSQTGVTYTLYNSGGTSQGSKAGTGSGLTWNTLAAGTGYYVTSVGATPTSCPGGSNTADVTSVANPVDLVLTGSSICASNPGTGTISSSTSQTGVTYTLYNSGGTSQGSKAGTGSGLTWNTLAAGTGYYVTSVGATPTSCPGGSNTADVTSVANPVDLVLTGSSICASNPGTGTISSSTSQTGVTYTLYNSGGTSQGSKAGTGSGLTWNTLAAGTGYYVTSVGATPTSCPGGSNTADVTSVANPVDLVLTGSSICASNPGTGTISSSTSQTGVTYTLYNSGGTSQGSKAGTGSGLTWNTLAAGTGYYVTSVGATPTSCPGGSNTADVTSVANPVDLVLTGSSICASNPGTGTISSSTSQTGVTYTLYNSGGTSQGSKAGTGSGLTWNTLAAGTGYYVTSVGATPTSCPGGSNTADVTSVANPVDLVLTGSSICASNPGTGTISSSTSQTGVTYTLYNSGGTSQGSKAGTGSGLTWNTLAAGTGYYVTSVGATPTSCPGGSNTADVTSVANPVALSLSGSEICNTAPGTGTVTSSTSVLGVSYELFNASAVSQGVKAGTGSGLSWTGLNLGLGYYAIATGAAPTNCNSTSNFVNVTAKNCGAPYGTYTQGYYSGKGKSCDGINRFTSPVNLIVKLLNTGGTITIGNMGGSYIKFVEGSAEQDSATAKYINSIMPGGSTAKKLIAGEQCADATTGCMAGELTAQGRIGNILFSQTLALTLNSRMGTLSTFGLVYNGGQDAFFYTQSLMAVGGNTCGSTTPLPCSYSKVTLNRAVINYLTNNGTTPATITDLLTLANGLLAGTLTPGVGGVPTYAQVSSAADAINNGFDEWKYWTGSWNVNLSNPSGYLANANPSPTACGGTAGNTASLTYIGTTGAPYQYKIEWGAAGITAGLANTSYATLTNPITVNLGTVGAGSYTGTLTVNNNNTGCTDIENFTVNVAACRTVNSNLITDATTHELRIATTTQDQPNESVSIAGTKSGISNALHLAVSAFPNPYTDKVVFTIQSGVSGHGVLEVYNLRGQKIQTVFDGNVFAGKSQTVQFNVSPQNRSTLMYRLTVNGKQVSGKLIRP